jgi:selenocysteine-specific elongation factor
MRASLLARVTGDGLALSALSARERAVIPTLESVTVRDGRAYPADASGLSAAATTLLSTIDAGGFSPPAVSPSAELRALAREGLAVESDGVWFSTAVVKQAAQIIGSLLVETPAGVTVGQIRDALGSSRKHVLPLLAHLDATGVTRRRGDVRIAGPLLGVARERGD